MHERLHVYQSHVDVEQQSINNWMRIRSFRIRPVVSEHGNKSNLLIFSDAGFLRTFASPSTLPWCSLLSKAIMLLILFSRLLCCCRLAAALLYRSYPTTPASLHPAQTRQIVFSQNHKIACHKSDWNHCTTWIIYLICTGIACNVRFVVCWIFSSSDFLFAVPRYITRKRKSMKVVMKRKVVQIFTRKIWFVVRIAAEWQKLSLRFCWMRDK